MTLIYYTSVREEGQMDLFPVRSWRLKSHAMITTPTVSATACAAR
jgi:hypothetical protein